MSQLSLKQKAIITQEQISNIISTKLWDLGLLPDIPIELKTRENGTIEIQQEERQVSIPTELANAVSVRVVS